MLLVEAIMCTTVGIILIIFFREAPPSPPTISAATPKESFKQALRTVTRNKPYIILVLSFGIGMGSFYAVSTLLDQIVAPQGYSGVSLL